MMSWFRRMFAPDTLPADEPPEDTERKDTFSTHSSGLTLMQRLRKVSDSNIRVIPSAIAAGEAMDTATQSAMDDLKSAFTLNNPGPITDTQLAYFGSQAFIGYQLMAIMAQNWLISKACLQPAKDAIRHGYELTGPHLTQDVLDFVAECDRRYHINKHMREWVYFGRVYGIRIAKFDIDYEDPKAYEKPFNPDGIRPGTYKGITQIDPYWITPELNGDAAANPDSQHFYEPTWWRVNGKRIHRSHLVIFRGPEVGDILKPTYLYGGLSVTQQIFERVYAAERTANEAPMLAQSKRATVLHVDVEAALADQEAFEQKLRTWVDWVSNFSVKVVGLEESIEQFETSLADLDATIMTQYQLVAAIAEVPVTKLLGTVPKGFNATGEFDEASYHETLESLQEEISRLLERHHLCVMRSEVRSKFPDAGLAPPIPAWHTLDAMTEKEEAEVNKLKAETGAILVGSGAIDGIDERTRLQGDPDSGYGGIEDAIAETINEEEIPNA